MALMFLITLAHVETRPFGSNEPYDVVEQPITY